MITLSELLKNTSKLNLYSIVIYLLENDFHTVVNDLAPEPHIEYDIEDMPFVIDEIINKLTN